MTFKTLFKGTVPITFIFSNPLALLISKLDKVNPITILLKKMI